MPTQADKQLIDHAADFWFARAAVVVIACLQLLVVNDLTVQPSWLAPAIELAILIPLSGATAWTQLAARRAQNEIQWNFVGRNRRRVKALAILLTSLATLINFIALVRLIAAMIEGHAGAGKALLLDAVNIWLTNVVIFSLWFWTVDGGGAGGRDFHRKSDFIFTQQQLAVENAAFRDWSPRFIDYVFLAFTNSTAFSPADTFPLTARAKILMMIESGTSLVTIAVVAARAVGILA